MAVGGLFWRRAAAAALLMAAAAGCEKDASAVPQVALGEVDAVRREAFVRATAEALKSFEELDVPSMKIDCAVGPDGKLTVFAKSETRANPEIPEKALSLALTNVALNFPGVGFVAEGDRAWRVLFPDEVKIPVSGPFNFGVLGTRQ